MSEKIRTANFKRLAIVLVVEILAVFFIVGIFKWVDDRMWAAKLASLSFVLQGAFILCWLWPWGRRNWTLTVPTMLLFQFIFVLPMAGFRWLTDLHFSQLKWMGMTGPTLHSWSSQFYYLLFIATIIDLIVALYRRLPSR